MNNSTLIIIGLCGLVLMTALIATLAPSAEESVKACVENTNYSEETCIFQVGR